MKKRALIVATLVGLSALLTLILTEYRGDDWEESIRGFYYNAIVHSSPPSPYIVIADTLGIPFVHYAGYGSVDAQDQYNPTTVAIYALNYAELIKEGQYPKARVKFFNCMEWLTNNMTYKNGYALYEFGWQQPFYPSVRKPWSSGLTSGKAIEAFTSAYQITHDIRYLNAAKLLVQGFFQPIQKGGFTYQDSTGWWYEEYADAGLNTPRVLNGHIYSFLGVRKFWLQTKDDSAAFIVEKGMEALINKLPAYDVGDGWSYYDIFHKKDDKKYHKMMVELMNQLWKITGNSVFYRYYIKWKAPMELLYMQRVIKENNHSGLVLFLSLFMLSFLLMFSLFRILWHRN